MEQLIKKDGGIGPDDVLATLASRVLLPAGNDFFNSGKMRPRDDLNDFTTLVKHDKRMTFRTMYFEDEEKKYKRSRSRKDSDP